jgi:2-oxoglutarate ferredoxin oxidoreductase subunit beta
MNVQARIEDLKPKDFATDQEVRWCPGCGDYAILKGVQKTLADIGTAPENVVFVSGIGCSSRFPYYVKTYGFHTIHGRAPAVASGVKLANPELDVWIITGDGDGLSIGGNHLLHVLRRNLDVQVLMFNNEIYGLTKGQYSPTSRVGTRSPSTPQGSVDRPISPVKFALGANASFVARTVDIQQKHMPDVLLRAHGHNGAAFVEIFQNCNVYNDKVFADFTDRAVALDRQIALKHGEPMLFGKDSDRGLQISDSGFALEVVTLGENGITEADVAIHDETNSVLAGLLADMQGPDFPVAIGVLFCDPKPSFSDAVYGQIAEVREKAPKADLNALLRSGTTWTVTD